MTITDETDGEYADFLNLSPWFWTRPSGPTRVWRIVKGRKKTADGQIPSFSIQEVPKELEDDVVEFMVKYFLAEEPISIVDRLDEDPIAVRENRTIWRHMVRQGVSIVALMVNSDPNAKPVIVGANMLSVLVPEKEVESNSTLQYHSEGMKRLAAVISTLSEGCDVMRKYGVDRYLSSIGLSVHPSFYGQGLGEEILRARDDIGLAYQIPVSRTVFSGTASQIVAARIGYEVLVEKRYSELLDHEGNIAYPGIDVEFIKLMAKRLY